MWECILAQAPIVPRVSSSLLAAAAVVVVVVVVHNGLELKCTPTPLFLYLLLDFSSSPQLSPSPLCILTITNYRHWNAGRYVWPGACRILYRSPH